MRRNCCRRFACAERGAPATEPVGVGTSAGKLPVAVVAGGAAGVLVVIIVVVAAVCLCRRSAKRAENAAGEFVLQARVAAHAKTTRLFAAIGGQPSSVRNESVAASLRGSNAATSQYAAPNLPFGEHRARLARRALTTRARSAELRVWRHAGAGGCTVEPRELVRIHQRARIERANELFEFARFVAVACRDSSLVPRLLSSLALPPPQRTNKPTTAGYLSATPSCRS